MDWVEDDILRYKQGVESRRGYGMARWVQCLSEKDSMNNNSTLSIQVQMWRSKSQGTLADHTTIRPFQGQYAPLTSGGAAHTGREGQGMTGLCIDT